MLLSPSFICYRDCCGLVVPLPLDLSVVRRFDLSGQAKYFFFDFKNAKQNKTKQETATKQQEHIFKEKKNKMTMYKRFKIQEGATTARQYSYHQHY